MSGNTDFELAKFTWLIHYIGQTPIRSGRVGLAAILWRSDLSAYAKHGASITGADYVKACEPGEPNVPRPLLQAIGFGLRWGAIQHRIIYGRLRWKDAAWIARQWQHGVPV